MKWTKKLDLDSPSKISIQPDVGMITKKDRPFAEGLIQFLLINVIALGSIFTGLSYIDIHTSVIMLLFESLLISVILCFSKSNITKTVVISACALLLVWLRNDIIKGAFLLIDEYAQLLDMPFKAPFRPEAVLTDYAAVTLFLSAYLLLMLLVLYYSVFITKNFIFTFAVSFIMPEIGLYNGDVPNYLSAFMLVAAWVCVFAMQLNDYHANRAGKKNVFTRQKRKNVFYMTERGMKNSAFGQLCVQLCIFMAAALLLAVAGSTFAGYKRSDRINVMRRELTYDFSVKTIVNTLQELSGLDLPIDFPSVSELGSAAVSGGMAKGDLSKVNDIRFRGAKLMEITLDSQPSSTLYLRGYAAGRYSDSHWYNTSADKSERDFSVSGTLGSVYSSLAYASNENTYDRLISIKDLTKSGILFSPYFSTFSGLEDISDVSYDYLKTRKDSYGLSYKSLDDTPDVVYKNIGLLSSLSSFDISGYFMAVYQARKSADPSVMPRDVLEDMAISRVLSITGLEDKFMRDLIYGINMYLNYGQDQAYLYAYIEDPTDAVSLADRYTIFLEHMDSSGGYEPTEEITFNQLIELAYEGFERIPNHDRSIEDALYIDQVFENYLNVDIDLDIDNKALGSIYTLIMQDYPFNDPDNAVFVDDFTFAENYATRVTTIIENIKMYFSQNYAYSLQNPKTPAGEDFIEYFLNEMDSGSCTYFSSAAVELLRYFGIPARYAEGFMIPLDELKARSTPDTANGGYKMDILDNYAHAWVEVFMPGVGWLPVDFTLAVEQMQEEITTTTTTAEEETSESTTTMVTTTSVTTPSETSVTTAPQGGVSQTNTTGSANSNTGGKGETKAKGILLTVCAAVLVIVMFALAYLACISAIRRSLKDSINEADENKRAVNIYDIVLMYLACIGIRCGENISDKDRCERLCEMLEKAGITGLSDELRAACALAVEAGMSGGEITPEENKQMMVLLKKVREICYEKMSKMQRFTAKYIKGLY